MEPCLTALSITCHWISISNKEILEAIDFSGARVCLTGKLRKSRHDYENLLKEAGATIAFGISKTTDYLIARADAGSKLAKAEELNIPVLTEDQMTQSLGQAVY